MKKLNVLLYVDAMIPHNLFSKNLLLQEDHKEIKKKKQSQQQKEVQKAVQKQVQKVELKEELRELLYSKMKYSNK